MSAAGAVIGIDAGGSRTRAVLVTLDGRIAARAERAAANPRTVGAARATDEIASAVAQLRDRLDGPLRHVAIGGAGRLDAAPERENTAWAERVGADGATVDSDARIAHAAAFGADPGVVVVAGTGSQCLAITTAGERIRIGGWGPTFGDEGSAFWIARRAIGAALRDLDDRAESALGAALLHTAGVAADAPATERTRRLLDALYAPSSGPREHARFATIVADLSAADDATATELLVAAGDALADLAARAAASADMLEVSYAGSVLNANRTVRAAFVAALERRGLRVGAPRWAPALGAAYLALAAAGVDAERAARAWPADARIASGASGPTPP